MFLSFKESKKKENPKDSPYSCCLFLLFSVLCRHIAFDVEANHFGFGIGA